MRRVSIPRPLRPVPPAQSPSPLPSLFLLGGIAQAAMTLPVFAAPFVAREFGLSGRDLAMVTGAMRSSATCFGVQAFAVADRLVDTELFPTRLRGTYAGVRMIGTRPRRRSGASAWPLRSRCSAPSCPLSPCPGG